MTYVWYRLFLCNKGDSHNFQFFVALTSILTGSTGKLALWSPEAIRAGFLASVALVTSFAGATAIFGIAFQGVLLHTLTFGRAASPVDPLGTV